MKSVSKSEEIYFLSGKRTPFGTYGGSLKDLSATDLAVESAKAALAQAKVAPELVEHVVYGNVVQTSADAIYIEGSDDPRPAPGAADRRRRSPGRPGLGAVR